MELLLLQKLLAGRLSCSILTTYELYLPYGSERSQIRTARSTLVLLFLTFKEHETPWNIDHAADCPRSHRESKVEGILVGRFNLLGACLGKANEKMFKSRKIDLSIESEMWLGEKNPSKYPGKLRYYLQLNQQKESLRRVRSPPIKHHERYGYLALASSLS